MDFLIRILAMLLLLAIVGGFAAVLARRDPSGISNLRMFSCLRLLASGLFLFMIFVLNYMLATRGLTFLTGYERISGAGNEATRGQAPEDPIGLYVLFGDTEMYLGTLWGFGIILAAFLSVGLVVKAYEDTFHRARTGFKDWARDLAALLVTGVLAYVVLKLDLLVLMLRSAMALSPRGYRRPDQVPSLDALLNPSGPTMMMHSFLESLLWAYPVIIFVAEVHFGRSLSGFIKSFAPNAALRQPETHPTEVAPAAPVAPTAQPVQGTAQPPAPEQPQAVTTPPQPLNGVVRRIPRARRR